jgi:primosomal protein N' (replication factor Y)
MVPTPSEQRNLFDCEPAPWDLDDQAEQRVARVVFPAGIEGSLDYLVPQRLEGQVEPGRRVRVPLGRANRPVVGYCVEVATRPTGPRALKPISAVVDGRSLLSAAMLQLTGWIADHYLCPWGVVLEAVIPAGVRGQAGTRETKFFRLAPDAAERLAAGRVSPGQSKVVKALSAAGEPLSLGELTRAARCTPASVESLCRRGVLGVESRRVAKAASAPQTPARQPRLELNADQQVALAAILEAIDSRRHRTLLVHGVTGSGKTEVYIQAIQEVVRFGRQAIVLVPEISLTPQTVERFRCRFDRVAVLHSHLSDVERHAQWTEIASGRVQVIVGARSAIFAPTPHLGLIVLDEEHEASFKQETAPRYHAREVARARSEAEGVPLVLGSATPALETWYRAQTGEYRRLSMPRRVLDRPLPRVGTVDLRDEIRSRGSCGAISRALHLAMNEALSQGGQVILLLNRRGFATHIQCPACGKVVQCPNCEIALTHHRSEEIALCHYCDHQVPAPAVCPECRFPGIRYSGQGTQRLEMEVKARFPGFPCLRMDTDTMQGRGAHQRALDAFRSGKVSILLGTQMIAKGLDFPEVTLVGVINADTALHLPDFRAAERTFQLVTQVAGRTGRGEKGGRVLVQTFNPDHPAIQAATRHDYVAFAGGELPLRKAFSYPPFAGMIRLVVRGPVEQVAQQFAQQAAEQVRAILAEAGAAARVLGPAPAPFSKLRGLFRFQIQLQSADAEGLRGAVRRLIASLQPPADVQWIADVDPLEML